MPPRFQPGAIVYAVKDGRRYVVEEAVDGTVYCASPGGGEAEFPEAQLQTEAEWSARSGGRREMLYGRIKQARAYTGSKSGLDRAAAEQTLAKAERVQPGILDFTAYTVAKRVLDDTDNREFAAELSIIRCRDIFDAATPETRASLLANLIGASPETLISAGRLGDNLMRAMIDKGLEASAGAFEEFSGRRRQ